jgi:hypothetical protein
VKKHPKLLITYFLTLIGLAVIVWLTPTGQRLDIHDRTTFRMVGLLGIFQTSVALYGGYLAVLALPPEEKSKVHGWVIAILGLWLFALTFVVGVLSDHSQFELTGKLNLANEALRKIALNKGGLTDEDRKYISGVLTVTSSSRRIPVPAPTAPTPTAPPPSTTAAPPVTKPPDRSVERVGEEAVRQTLSDEIGVLSNKLNDLDSTARGKREGIGIVVSKAMRAGNVPLMDSKTIQDLTAIDDNETHQYLTELLPLIKALREHIHRVYATSKTGADEQQFEAANKVASSPSHIPQNPQELFESRGGKMNPMKAYLSSLQASMTAALLQLHAPSMAPESYRRDGHAPTTKSA